MNIFFTFDLSTACGLTQLNASSDPFAVTYDIFLTDSVENYLFLPYYL